MTLKEDGSINSYKEKNSDVLDILFSMTEFEKFKTQMINFKKGMVDKDQKQIEEELKKQNEKSDVMDYQKFMALYNEDLSTWNKKLEDKAMKDGFKCTVYQRPNLNNPIDLVRIDAVMLNINPEDIIDYFMNPPND